MVWQGNCSQEGFCIIYRLFASMRLAGLNSSGGITSTTPGPFIAIALPNPTTRQRLPL